MQGPKRSVGVVVFAVLLALFGAAPASGASWSSRELAVAAPELAPGATGSKLLGVSCVSTSLCVAVGESGAIASTTDPTSRADRWKIVRPYDPAVESDYCHLGLAPGGGFETVCPQRYMYRQVRAVSCPSASLCVAVTFDGYVYSSSDPTGPATSWRVVDVDDGGRDTHLESISCPDPGFCVAVSGDRNTAGKILTTSSPTGPASAWQVAQLDPTLDIAGVSCASRGFCVAAASNGRILRSTNPAGGASAWELVGAPGGPGNLDSVACTDRGTLLCLAGNSGGNLLVTQTAGAGYSSWGEVSGGASVPITGISCPTQSRCAAVDNNGNVLLSGAPAVAGSWSATNLLPFAPATASQGPLNALFGVSCPTDGLCVLVGARGMVFTSTDPIAGAPPPSVAGKGNGKGKPSGRRFVKRPKTFFAKVDRFREMTHRQRLKVNFRFYAKSKVRGFVCKRDRRRYRRCRSPLRYWVGFGDHELRVRAVGPTGLRGPVAMVRFRAYRNPAFD
jgi:hypothetical protein